MLRFIIYKYIGVYSYLVDFLLSCGSQVRFLSGSRFKINVLKPFKKLRGFFLPKKAHFYVLFHENVVQSLYKTRHHLWRH